MSFLILFYTEKTINQKRNSTVEKKLWNKSSKVAFKKEFAVHLENNCGYPGILSVLLLSFFTCI